MIPYLNCKSTVDTHLIGGELFALPFEQCPYVAAQVASKGLMRAPWWLRLSVKLGSWRSGLPIPLVWASIYHRWPDGARDLVDQTAEWAMTGEDAHGEGVGGFDQREINLLAEIVRTAA